MQTNASATEACTNCPGSAECAPTALLLLSLMHTLYGTIGEEPDYFGNKEQTVVDQEFQKDIKHKYSEITPQKLGSMRKGIGEDQKEDPDLYDFIIVGGGTAGCVLASRLSENKRWKILLLEAGIEEPKISIIPSYADKFAGSTVDWKFSMRPKPGFCLNRGGKGCAIIQGRTLGGTSSINHMMYTRGNAADYDGWEQMGNEGWKYSSVLPYFKYSEGNYDKDIFTNKLYHSKNGPLDVGRYPYVDENVDVLLSALDEMGLNYTDVNAQDQIGFMRFQTMSYFGERVSTQTAFIEPIRKVRNKLEIITEALVTKVILEEGARSSAAKGVEYLKNGIKKQVFSSKETIVSAGAINSPKLLMQSGIGPRSYLEYLDIDVIADLPVGANLHDHVSVCLPIILLLKTQKNSNFSEKLKDITKYYKKSSGPISSNFQVAAFIETQYSSPQGTPDVEIRFRGSDSSVYYNKMDVCVSLLTPKSFGQVILNSSDPIFGKPLIYPNFLKEESDVAKILEGIFYMIKIFDTKIFKLAGFEFDPKAIIENNCKDYDSVSNDFWICIIRHFSAPLHNYVGTCKMGPAHDPGAVVDNKLRVHGINQLRVVDSSVIPLIPRGSTAAPVIMIAEKTSDSIKDTWYQ